MINGISARRRSSKACEMPNMQSPCGAAPARSSPERGAETSPGPASLRAPPWVLSPINEFALSGQRNRRHDFCIMFRAASRPAYSSAPSGQTCLSILNPGRRSKTRWPWADIHIPFGEKRRQSMNDIASLPEMLRRNGGTKPPVWDSQNAIDPPPGDTPKSPLRDNEIDCLHGRMDESAIPPGLARCGCDQTRWHRFAQPRANQCHASGMIGYDSAAN